MKKNKIRENIIGHLLLSPIFIVSLLILYLIDMCGIKVLKIDGIVEVVMGISIFLPVLIGIILSYIYYGNQIKKHLLTAFIIIIGVYAAINFYETYFVNLSGFEGIGSFYFFIISTIIMYISAACFYNQIVGFKRTFFQVVLYGVYFSIPYIIPKLINYIVGYFFK